MSEGTDAHGTGRGVTVELRLFADFRAVVGQKHLEREYPGDTVAIGEVLHDLTKRYPDLDFFDDDGEVREYVSILKNGKDIVHLEGKATPIETGDRVSLFPPVAGG